MFSGRLLGLVGAAALLLGCGPATPPAATTAPIPTLVGKKLPSLAGALTWLNSSEIQSASLTGKVVLVHFFDYSCVNCIRTYPYIQEWDRRYAPLGMQVVGVHAPQYEFAMDPANVRSSAKRYGLTYPIAVDSYLKIAEAFSNRFWPRLLIIDQTGIVRFDHTGEGDYAEAEQMIQSLLRPANPSVQLPALVPAVHDFDRPGAVCYPITQELYLGRARGQLANPEAASTNSVIQFTLPATREEGKICVQGGWEIRDEYMRHAVDQEKLTDCLTLKYRAIEFNVVMKPESIYWMQVFVEQDGKPVPRESAGKDLQYDADGQSFVKVDEARMYNITNKEPYGAYEMRLSVRGKGLSVYSFSFGTCPIPKDDATLRSTKETL